MTLYSETIKVAHITLSVMANYGDNSERCFTTEQTSLPLQGQPTKKMIAICHLYSLLLIIIYSFC